MQRVLRFSFRFLPLTFVVFAVVLCGYGFQVSNALGAPAGIQSDASADIAREIRPHIDDIRGTLQILFVAAGFFAVAQAALSYFNAQGFTRQAEDAVKRIEALGEQLESRFPNFMEAEQMEILARKTLDQLGNTADWRGTYESLELRRRQSLLTVDSWVALDMRPRPQDVARYGKDLYKMALLYASKYEFNRSLGGGSVGDVERAEYYLELASDYLGKTHYVLNELGLLYLEFYDARDPRVRQAHHREAERLFTESLRDKPEQQRAFYNLGVLATRRNDWQKAADQYERALHWDTWEGEERRPDMLCNVLYNAACAYARLGRTEKVVENLRKAADLGYVDVATVDRDLEGADGDFVKFLGSADESIQKELAGLRTKLSARVGEHPVKQQEKPAGALRQFADKLKKIFRF